MNEQPSTSKSLLSNKELAISACLEKLVAMLEQNSKLGMHEENNDYLEMCINEILMTYPIVFRHRYAQILKECFQKKMTLQQFNSLSCIEPAQSSIQALSQKYTNLFNAWVDNEECVSFSTGNKALAGSLSLKDCFILNLFAFATCRRIKSDNCYALAVTGKSTAGKSTLFENPLLEYGHSYNVDSGVGRFCLGSKNILIAQDVDIKVLISGKDAAKFRCIARGEPIKFKTFGSEATLKPTFLFLTSNENIQTHIFTKENVFASIFERKIYPSQLSYSRKRPHDCEFIRAIQNRFLEAFVRKQPHVQKQYLPTDGQCFERIHLILGLFERVLNILELSSVSFDDYGSKSLFRYCLSGLEDNLPSFREHMTLGNINEITIKLSKSRSKIDS